MTTGGQSTLDHLVFLQALDALREGLGFFSTAADLLHANLALRSALDDGADGGHLRQGLAEMVEAVSCLARERPCSSQGGNSPATPLVDRCFQTPRARYQIRGSFVEQNLFGSHTTVIVTLIRSPTPSRSDEVLHERFGFSRAESQAARLIAEGRSNREVAEAMRISPNTARNHTSRILTKLKARSRAEVGPRLREE